MIIHIDARTLKSKAELYAAINAQCPHNEFTPTNLDALNDRFGELTSRDRLLEVVGPKSLQELLGEEYYHNLLEVFYENHFRIYLRKEP